MGEDYFRNILEPIYNKKPQFGKFTLAKSVTFRLSAVDHARLEQAARRDGRTRTVILTELVKKYLDEEEQSD